MTLNSSTEPPSLLDLLDVVVPKAVVNAIVHSGAEGVLV